MRIQTEGVKFDIGNKNILKGISIDVNSKEIIGIIGPNGSGKSTFLKCIYRTLKPSSGIIKLGDINLDGIKLKESAKKMAVVSQHNYYDFDFSVGEMVLMGRSPHKKMMERDSYRDYEIMNDALKRVDMLHFKDRNFNSLSGGEQQRIILARALAQETDCLILDEPTNHLDVEAKDELKRALKEYKGSILLVCHEPEFYRDLVTDVWSCEDWTLKIV